MKKVVFFLYTKSMKITVAQPYNNNDLVFNEETGRYELTMEYVKANFEITFKDDGILQKRITKNSRRIYNYLYSRGYSFNNPIITFFLNKTENGRRFLVDVLSSQMEADLLTSFNDLGITPAVTSNAQMLDRNQMRANLVCVDVEEMVDNNNEYFGFNLFISSQLPATLFTFVRENDK